MPAAKKGTTLYDVVITSADADTVVVRDVPVNAGTEVTTLQSTPIMLTAARIVYADVAPSPVALPAGTRLEFHQTLQGRDQVPFVIDGTALDPDTRQVPGAAFALASGSLVVGDYAGGNAVSFVADTPAEGTGGYLVGSTGLYRSATFAANPAESLCNAAAARRCLRHPSRRLPRAVARVGSRSTCWCPAAVTTAASSPCRPPTVSWKRPASTRCCGSAAAR